MIKVFLGVILLLAAVAGVVGTFVPFDPPFEGELKTQFEAGVAAARANPFISVWGSVLVGYVGVMLIYLAFTKDAEPEKPPREE